MDAHSPWFMSTHKLLNNLRSKSSTGRFIPGCQAHIRAQTWQDFTVTLATEQLFTYRPLGLHQGPFCFSVVLALVPGALSFMSTSCLSVKAARREAKHPPLVGLGELSARHSPDPYGSFLPREHSDPTAHPLGLFTPVWAGSC